MSGIEIVAGILQPIAGKVYDTLGKYNADKKIKDKLYFGLQNEIENYDKCIDVISITLDSKFIPKIDALSPTYSKNQINELININSELLGLYGGLINSQINLILRCKNMTFMTKLMDDLKSFDDATYEFFMLSKDIVLPNKVVVYDNRLITFFKVYQNDLFKYIDDEELEKASSDVKFYISKIKNILRPSLTSDIITRETKKVFFSNIKYLGSVSKKMKIDKSVKEEAINYIPKKLKPLLPLFEELKKIEEENKKILRYRKNIKKNKKII